MKLFQNGTPANNLAHLFGVIPLRRVAGSGVSNYPQGCLRGATQWNTRLYAY